MENNIPQQEQNLFDDFRGRLVQAGGGQRLANYIIDLISFYIFIFILGMLLAFLSPETADFLFDGNDTGFRLLDRLLTLLMYGLYMGLVETLFGGRSLGKLITGTIAVNEDGSRISAQTAFLRGLSRAVPFNAFSALGSPCYPWHDKWNNTYVVEIRHLNSTQQE